MLSININVENGDVRVLARRGMMNEFGGSMAELNFLTNDMTILKLVAGVKNGKMDVNGFIKSHTGTGIYIYKLCHFTAKAFNIVDILKAIRTCDMAYITNWLTNFSRSVNQKINTLVVKHSIKTEINRMLRMVANKHIESITWDHEPSVLVDGSNCRVKKYLTTTNTDYLSALDIGQELILDNDALGINTITLKREYGKIVIDVYSLSNNFRHKHFIITHENGWEELSEFLREFNMALRDVFVENYRLVDNFFKFIYSKVELDSQELVKVTPAKKVYKSRQKSKTYKHKKSNTNSGHNKNVNRIRMRLKRDILDKYDNPEYWSKEVVNEMIEELGENNLTLIELRFIKKYFKDVYEQIMGEDL